MENYFHPDINKFSKSARFLDTQSKYKDFKIYQDGKILKTRPEKWVKRKKKLIKNKLKKNKNLEAINIQYLKKKVKNNKGKYTLIDLFNVKRYGND